MDERLAPLDPVESLTVVDAVAESIRQAIVAGRLSPGQRLTESMLTDLLQVSRRPVREALSRLAAAGLITGDHSKRVWDPVPGDVDEVFSLRNVLCSLAVDWVFDRLEDDDFAEVESLVLELLGSMGDEELGSLASLLEAQERFQEYLCRKSGHRWLQKWWEQLNNSHAVLVHTRLNELHSPAQAASLSREILEIHRNILIALHRHDAARVKTLIKASTELTNPRRGSTARSVPIHLER